MKNLYSHLPAKTLLNLNIFSVAIIALCEIFVIYTFLTKGANPELERWKYLAILGGVIVISVFFIVSLITLIFFIRKVKKQKTTSS